MAQSPSKKGASSSRKSTGHGVSKSEGTQIAPRPKPKKAKGNRVAIVGGGLAGMSAALRLQQAGFEVTLFEKTSRFGGNTSSEEVNGIEHDVYPHMFCQWYDNFWELYEKDLGLSREKHFEAKPGARIIEPGNTASGQLFNPTSLKTVIANLKSGVLSPAEMFLLGYSTLDLAAHPFDRSGLNEIEMLSVNGFIYSRGYSTENVAAMQNYLLTLVWSIQSSWTAAATYQNFLRHSYKFPNHSPFCYLLRGSLQNKLIVPWLNKLEEFGCELRPSTEVVSVRVEDDDRPIVYSRPAEEGAEYGTNGEHYDYVVLSMPVEPLSKLVICNDRELRGRRIADCEPALSNLQRLSSVSIPVVDVYFKCKLKDFSNDHIGLAQSKYGLTVLDISELWEDGKFDGNSALILAASEGPAIPSLDPEDQGWLIMQEFQQYFPDLKKSDGCKVNFGKHWNDPDSDIDWDKTYARTNDHWRLFLNDTGSWRWRPVPSYPVSLPRVLFAGDVVRSDVDMATVESAVQSGFQVAMALQDVDSQINHQPPRGAPITLAPHTVYSTASFRGAQLLYLPFAYAALGIVAFEQWKKNSRPEDGRLGENDFTLTEYMALVPLQFTVDWLKGAYWFVRALVDSGDDDPLGGRVLYKGTLQPLEPVDPSGVVKGDERVNPKYDDDNVIGLPKAILMVADEVLDYFLEGDQKIPHEAQDRAKKDTTELAADVAVSAVELALKMGGKALNEMGRRRAKSGRQYRRRWSYKA